MIGRLLALTAAERRHLVAAPGYLLRAKALHLRMEGAAIRDRLRGPPGAARISPPDPALMNWALAAVSRRLPWRSDCLVQALAGKLWLDRAGLPSELTLAARRDGRGEMAAHAWLTVGGEVATGGPVDPDLAPFTPSREP